MRVFAIGLLALSLAACGEKGADVEEGDASGEVLPGSISDDMIALDRLRSEAPLDPTGESVPDGGEDGEDGLESVDEADEAAEEEPAAPVIPAESVTTTPEPTAQPKAPPKAAPPPPVSVLPTKKTGDD